MRWEYLIIDGPAGGKGLVDELNRAGEAGFEAVTSWSPKKGTIAFLLKRLADDRVV